MDREAWRAAVHVVSKSQARLSDRIELMLALLYTIFYCVNTMSWINIYLLSVKQILLDYDFLPLSQLKELIITLQTIKAIIYCNLGNLGFYP